MRDGSATAATPRGYQLKDAAELSLSVKTIANNVSNIFSKLEVADRAEAIIRARVAGLTGKAAKLDHPR